MSEPAAQLAQTPAVEPWRRRAIETGRIAGLLAAHLARLGTSPVQELIPFLEARRASGAGLAPVLALAASTDPLDRLVAGCALTPLEIDLLLLSALPEEHEGYAAVLRRLNPTGEPWATVGLATQLFCQTDLERWQLQRAVYEGAAIRAGIFHLRGEGPLGERSIAVADCLWSALRGIEAWPALFAAGLRAHNGTAASWPTTAAAERALRALQRSEPCLLLVTADSPQNAADYALFVVQQADKRPMQLSLSLPISAELQRLLHLHALVRDQIPILSLTSPGQSEGAPVPAMLQDLATPLVLCMRRGALRLSMTRPVLELPVPELPLDARQKVWSALLPDLSLQAPLLASRYILEPPGTAAVALDACHRAALDQRPVQMLDVSDSVRLRSHCELPPGVQHVRPRAGWPQLVLPPDHERQLREVLGRLLHRGRVLGEWGYLAGRPGAHGVRLLLAGPPGTGKTLAAEVLAAELQIDLLVVDLSRVVSKWLGETEKNLAGVFDAAERAQAVLLFDEADALFGKRTEVSDAHDRYANLETAYLLSRLERFHGLAVLTTNLRQNIDPAFLRRIEFAIDFREPGERERLALWRCHVPDAAPRADNIDLAELAALYPLAGGLIRNAAVAAGFLAATEAGPLRRTHFIYAIRREYEKSGRAFPGDPWGQAGL